MNIKKTSLLEYLNSYIPFVKGCFEGVGTPRESGLKFSTDLGMKAVVMNDAFEMLDKTKYEQLVDMFDEQDLLLISKSKDRKWIPRLFKKLLISEEQLMVGRNTPKDEVTLSNEQGLSFMIPRGFVTTYFTRSDEGFSPVDSLVPLTSTHQSVVKAMKLPKDDKWAVALFHPGRKETLLLPMTNDALSFLTEVSK